LVYSFDVLEPRKEQAKSQFLKTVPIEHSYQPTLK